MVDGPEYRRLREETMKARNEFGNGENYPFSNNAEGEESEQVAQAVDELLPEYLPEETDPARYAWTTRVSPDQIGGDLGEAVDEALEEGENPPHVEVDKKLTEEREGLPGRRGSRL